MPPVSASAYLRAAATEWVKSEAEGFLVKKLYEDPARGEKTCLMKIQPGAFAPSHTHDEFEQFYVLEGSLYDDAGPLEAGDFVCRPPGMAHFAGSREGAVVLLVYTRHASDAGAVAARQQTARGIGSSSKEER